MFRKFLLTAAMAAVPAGLVLASGGLAAASANPVPASCTGVIQITHLAFSPPEVSPGQLSTASLTARNCTRQTQQTSFVWFARFTGPGIGIPPGCPAIDPLPPQQVTFAPLGKFTTSVGFVVPPSCTATQLQVTFDFDQNGIVIAQKTADLIIVPLAATG